MKKYLFLIGLIAIILFVAGWVQQDKAIKIVPPKAVSNFSLSQCLPSDINLSDIVDAKLVTWYSDGRPPVIDKVTVDQELIELKATCIDNKLVDGSGKEIYFYHLTGCWGASRFEDQEIMQKQQDEINKLKEQYMVIEMTCNPSGISPA